MTDCPSDPKDLTARTKSRDRIWPPRLASDHGEAERQRAVLRGEAAKKAKPVNNPSWHIVRRTDRTHQKALTARELHRMAVRGRARENRRKRLFAADPCCYWCREPMQIEHRTRETPSGKIKQRDDFASFEHLIPRSKGGRWGQGNIVLAHAGCNRKRGSNDLPPTYLLRRAFFTESTKPHAPVAPAAADDAVGTVGRAPPSGPDHGRVLADGVG